MKRKYQRDFFQTHSSIRDLSKRQKKAEKIRHILQETFGNHFLDTCLDIGCSAGYVTVEISDLFQRMYGVEFDIHALRNRPADSRNARFVAGDAMSLPFHDNSIDVMICAQVYEHVPDDRRLISEIYRVLKPGGTDFFRGPNKLYPIELHYNLPFLHWLPEKWADRYLQLFKMGDHYYERSRTIWSLRKLLAQFQIVNVTHLVLDFRLRKGKSFQEYRFPNAIPKAISSFFLPFLPNFNLILTKPLSGSKD